MERIINFKIEIKNLNDIVKNDEMLWNEIKIGNIKVWAAKLFSVISSDYYD